MPKQPNNGDDVPPRKEVRSTTGNKSGDLFGNIPSAPGKERHHTPAAAVLDEAGIPCKEGLAVLIDGADHRKTSSWGRSKDAQEYRDRQRDLIKEGRFKEAMEMDREDLNSRNPGKYDEHMDGAMSAAETAGYFGSQSGESDFNSDSADVEGSSD